MLILMLWNNGIAQSNFADAIEIASGESKIGEVGPANRYYYCKTALPANGTVTVYISGENKQGGAGSIDFYAYDRGRRQIAVKAVLGGRNIPQGEKFTDTVRIYSQAADSIYLLAYQNSSQVFDFTLRYEVLDQSANDPEPNDAFQQAKPLNHQQKIEGQIGYITNGVTDRQDYFKTMLPASGTVTIYVEGVHTGGGAGSIGLYAYDKTRRQIQSKAVLGGVDRSLGQNFKDTVRIYSREKDSIYIMMYQNSNQSFRYTLQYEVTDQNINDAEPNDDFPQAASIVHEETMYGRIGYVTNNVTDRNDYYKTLLPVTGTVKVYIEGTHTGGGAGSIDFYAYDKQRRQVFNKGILGNKNITLGETFRDTLEIHSRAADTLYFLMYQNSNQSFDYSIRYEMVNISIDDAEPNNSITEAVPITPGDTMYGRIGYVANNVVDRYDYYRAIMPADGTFTIYIRGTHTGGGTGSIDMYVYDKGNRQITAKGVLGGKNITIGQSFTDTVKVYSRAADTLYFSVYQNSNQSFDYALSYEVLDQSPSDIEPNNTLAQAFPIPYQEVITGHIGYVANSMTDRLDYYRAILPADGTVTVYIEGVHTGGSSGSIDLNVYDKGNRQIAARGILGGKNITLGDRFRDTLNIFSRAMDTIYFAVYQNSNQSFAYTLSYTVINQSANDPEPNNDFLQAKPIAHGETIEGHIGYVANNVTDRYDYFKTLLPVDGTVTVYIEGTHTGGGNGSIDFYAYDKNRRQIQVKGTLGGKNITNGETFRDTIEIASRAADSIYLLIYQNSSQSFNYRLRYNMPDALQGDPEPNNTFAQAVNFSIADTLKGLIGYVANAVNDNNDYYITALPAKGNLRIFVDAQNTGVNRAGFSVYAYDKNRRQLGVKVLNQVDPGASLKDTLTVNCVVSDSVYILVYQPSAGRSFAYDLQFVFDPQHPEAKFSYSRVGGTYEFTNESNLTTKYIWNMGNGEQYTTVAPPLIVYQPGGYDVQLIAENEFCRLRDTAKISLVVNGLTSYTPETGGAGNIVFTAYGGGFHDGMSIQLKQGSTVYKDSVTWINENGSLFGALVDMHNAPTGVYDVSIFTRDTTYNIPGGFVCQAAVYKVSGEIIGNDIIRANTNSTYTIRVRNEGNVMAGYTEVYILTPKNLAVTRLDSLIDLTFTTVHQDSLPEFIQVTKLDGYPIDGELRAYLLSGIPVGGYNDLRFNINGTEGVDKMYLWVKGPYSGSPFTTKGDDCFNARLKLLADLIWDGTSVIPGLDCAAGAFKAVGASIYNAFNYFTGRSSRESAGASLLKTLAGAVKDCASELALVAPGTAPLAPGMEYADIGIDLSVLLSDLDVNLQQMRADCEELEDEKEKPVDVRTSWDPNAKSGPAGFGAARYISDNNKRLNYTIFFENTATATLPAQEVVILDTLDKSVFDLSTFSAGSFGFGSRSINIPLGASEYIEDVDYDHNLAVRFYIKLDTETGIIRATFKTIDKATGVVTADPLAGFLPPNVNAPEGDGFVSFSIQMKDGLADGTVIANRASIIFDANEPILTEVWSNTIDRNQPSSRVTEARKLTDSTMMIKVNGNDLASGIKRYRLYVSENGSPYFFAGIVNDSVHIQGTPGKSYDFYSLAIDGVGNREIKNSTSEAKVQLVPDENNNNPNDGAQLLLYPVPSNGIINLELNVPETQQVFISVYTASGQRVAELYNGTTNGQLKISRSLHNLSNGLYFVHAKGSKGLNLKKKIILTK